MAKPSSDRRPKTFRGFQRAILRHVKELLKRDDVENDPKFAQAFENHLFRQPGPTRVARNLDLERQYIGEVFYGFNEIRDCVETFRDIEKFIGTPRYPHRQISRSRQIRYHYYAYLNELYIVAERLPRYMKRLARRLRSPAIFQTVDALDKLVLRALEGPVKIRGHHVHVAKHSHEDIDRVGTYELMLLVKDKDQWLFKTLYRNELRRTLEDLRRQMRTNRSETMKLLNYIFKELSKHLFDARGQLIIPARAEGPNGRSQRQ